MSVSGELTALREVYGTYLEEYRQRVVDNGPLHGLQKFLLGNSTASDRKADTAFFRGAEKAVEELLAALPGGESGEAEQAVRYMILEAEGTDASSRLMIEAAQALAIPLLEWTTPEEAGALAREYRARYPKKRMLAPRQRELLAALDRRAGGSV